MLLSLSLDAYQHQILQDVTLISLVALAIGVFLYNWLRSVSPNLQWNQQGKVQTQHIIPLDLLWALLIALPMLVTTLLPYKEPATATVTASNEQLGVGLLLFPLILSSAVLFILHQRKSLNEALGLKPEKFAEVVVWSMGAYICFFLLNILLGLSGLNEWIAQRLGEQQLQKVVTEMIHTENSTKLIMLIVGACVVAPITEEILFRGYLYPTVKRFTGPYLAVIVTGLLFGAIHGQVWALIPLSLFGMLLAILFECSGSLWACILTHALFNSVNVFMMRNPELFS